LERDGLNHLLVSKWTEWGAETTVKDGRGSVLGNHILVSEVTTNNDLEPPFSVVPSVLVQLSACVSGWDRKHRRH